MFGANITDSASSLALKKKKGKKKKKKNIDDNKFEELDFEDKFDL